MTSLIEPVDQIVAAPASPIRSHPSVTPESRSWLPDPNAILPEPHYEPVTTLFASWANRAPEWPAVCRGSRTWSYSELAESAYSLARVLAAHGVERGDVVAMFGPRRFGLIASMMGVLLSGGVLLTLDQNLPIRRWQLMLREAKAKYLLYISNQCPTDGRIWESLTTICVAPDTGRAILEPEDGKGGRLEAIHLPELTPDDAAYIFFTSGTSGVPKGVLGCHKGISHFVNWQRQTFAVGPRDRSAQLTGLSFDAILRDIFLPLTSGATLCLPIREDNFGPGVVLPWLEREQISILHTVPTLAQSWLTNVPTGVSLRALRWVFFSGESLQATLVRRWRETFPEAGEIVNFYGPTETTMVKCYYPVPLNVSSGVQPAGWPLPETQALILTKNNQLCDVGEPGEIVLRTPFRCVGYINAPEENRQRFVKNPFRDDEQDLVYYTGDRGRYRSDGSLEILGRLDGQIKIRGIRIEPGEIETVLSQHPNVWATVVVAREDHPGDKRLVAYVVLDQDRVPSTGELRHFLDERLPDYMIPSAFVVLDAFPMTPNNKIDRQALPAPVSMRPKSIYVAPRTALEHLLADMWQDVLAVKDISIHDDFFELGGNSIKGAILINKIQEQLQEVIYIVALFDAPTIANLADYLNEHYPEAVGKMLGLEASQIAARSSDRVTAAKIAQFRQLIPSLPLPDQYATAAPKNPPVIFIISPPRSGSTLLRVILAGHPQLFAPPMLELLSFSTLAERKTALSGRYSLFLEGTIRAIMQIKGCGAEQAQQIMQEYEDQHLSTQQFYRLMQQWIKDQTLVDKSATYALDLEILKRAEMDFENPLYIHLLRHPCGTIHSFERVRMDQIFFRYEHPFSGRELAELIWLVSHQNTLEFLKQVPRHRQHRVKFENLVTQPRSTVEDLCQFLNLDFDPEMLQPYKEKRQRMTDGLYPVSRMIGDPTFHEHDSIKAEIAGRWKRDYADENHPVVDFLGDLTWQMAESLGYKRIESKRRGSHISPISRVDRGSAEQLLAQLDQLSNEEVDSLLNDMLVKRESDE